MLFSAALAEAGLQSFFEGDSPFKNGQVPLGLMCA